MFLGLPLWAWVAMILFILISTLGQCAFLPPVA